MEMDIVDTRYLHFLSTPEVYLYGYFKKRNAYSLLYGIAVWCLSFLSYPDKTLETLIAKDLFICNLETETDDNGYEEERLHIYQGPYDTLVNAKRALKSLKGQIQNPVVIRIVGCYTNYIQGNPMFSNKDGYALADSKEMKIH